jgi:hypothetical protein
VVDGAVVVVDGSVVVVVVVVDGAVVVGVLHPRCAPFTPDMLDPMVPPNSWCRRPRGGGAAKSDRPRAAGA